MHVPVLLHEAVEALNLNKGEVAVDMTTGNGGHASKICGAIGSEGRLVCIDADREALKVAKGRIDNCEATFKVGNFSHIDTYLVEEGIDTVDGFLFDLGLRTELLKDSGRGFSFQKDDEPLVMTYADQSDLPEDTLTAEEIINTWKAEHIRDVLEGYGNEKYASNIAELIVQKRKIKTIKTTGQLIEIVKEALPDSQVKRRKHHVATKTFQALRIAVNDEIRTLKEAIRKSLSFLSSKGRMAIISFHSSEDRVVKELFGRFEKENIGHQLPPITPSRAEIKSNPQSRSAKLRTFSKCTIK